MGNPKGSQRDAPLTVTFPIPRKSAGKLRTMAVSRDRRLLDLGVLAVQINEGESIVLGIKLGKQRIKNTEVSEEKLRGNASRGRVKKPSTCRNVATIHHMPNAFSSQAPHAHKLQTTQTAAMSLGNDEGKRKKGTHSDGDVMGHNLFSDSRKTAGKPSNNCNQFRLSDFTNPCDLSLNGHSSSAELSAHHNNRLQNNALEEGFISSGSNVQKTTSPAVSSRKASVESYLSAAQTLSSPASQRAYSASPSSDTSSTSSEENFVLRHDQLIYNCFVDKSKYSASDMLKELAKSIEVKKTAIISTPVVNKVSHPIKTSVATAKSSSSRSSLLQQPKVLDNIKRSSYISGSYRDHVKSIRCNSLTSMTTSTSTVTATLKIPAATTDQTHGFQNSRSHIEKPSAFGDRIPSQLTQRTSQHITLSKPSTALQTKDIKTNPSKTAMYHGGRKVLWSSANAFPRSKALSAHSLFDKSVTDFSQGNSPCSKNSTSLSQVQETFSESTSRPSCMKSDAATCSDVIKSTPSETYCGIRRSNKMPEQGSVNGTIVTQSDSKTVLIKTPSLSFGSQELVTAQHASSPHVAESASSASFPEATSIVQTEHTSTAVVQNLTMGTPAIPAPIVVAGTNTQTTWSNQQVSPTYFVGAQGQYGIYSALYSPDINNNQLGQQAVAATTGYPLNYVYPVSFVYPYLTMAAQANNIKSSSNELQNRNAQVMQTDALIDKTKITKPEPGVDSKEMTVTMATATANLQPTTSTAPASAQTQFIDLTSSMRYWQQLNLLYRSRLQALASCNLSSASALSCSQVNTADTATSTPDSKESTTAVGNDEKAVKSNAEELSFSKPEISQANFSKGSYPEKTQINDFSKENVSSKILQPIKPEINVEEESGLNDMTDNHPSVVIIASSCDSVNKTLKSPVKIQCKQDDFSSGTKGTDSVSYGTSSVEICSAKQHHDRLRHMDDGSMTGAIPASLKRSFYGSPPKLSFIHDSSIACVNVGNSNGGNGFGSSPGSYTGARKIAFGTQLDTAVRPLKRKKSKKSV